jgi:GDP-D-mannose 3',5'-epimerase
MKKILVTGAGGFIAGHLVKKLAKNYIVRTVDKKPLNNWYQITDSVENIVGDLTDYEVALQVTQDIDEVYHLACDMGGMGFIEHNKTLCMLSIIPDTNTLKAAHANNARKFLFASTACIYPLYKQNTNTPDELIEGTEYPADPEDGYGWEKLFMERMCRHFSEDFGIETRIVRYHNVYGPIGTWDGGREKAPAALCRKVINALHTGTNSIDIWGDGEQTRSFLYIDDAVEGTIRVMDSEYQSAFNIGSDRMVSINRMVNVIESVSGTKVHRNYIDGPLGVRGRNSNNQKTKTLLNWEPRISLEDGLERTYKWIETQYVKKHNTDYMYYKKWEFSHLFETYNGADGHVVFEPWEGGFNNIRMSLELAVCIAYLTNRILVFPPKYKMYLLRDIFGLEDFFDTIDLGIKTITFTEFCNSHNIEHSYTAAKSICAVSSPHENDILNFTVESPPIEFTKGRNLADMVGLSQCNPNIYFDRCLLGNFYVKIYSHMGASIKQLIARHVHYLPSLFNSAKNAIAHLKDNQYYAMHIRRNDFQYKHLFINAEQILENIRDIVPEKATLYIATDHQDRTFFEPFFKKYNVVFYSDITHTLEKDIHYNYIPIIEQLICTRAIKFIGNDLSTMSSYIYRLRGYMSDIEDKKYYINTCKYREKDQVSFLDVEEFGGNWTREYKDVWEF